VQYAVVEGRQVYDKAEELYFAHIRPRPAAEVAPAERVDPGEEPAADQATSSDGPEGAGEDQERDE
jgi:hypothetical protein